MKYRNKFRLKWLPIYVGFFCVCFFSNDYAFAEKKDEKKTEKPAEGYTINFDNVSIKEFLRFISKIAGVNIIYNEADLNFNVTIFSEEETNLDNIMSALVQVLRIHNLTLIEEDQNLLIHKNDSVRQIPIVVSDEHPLTDKQHPAIITKVFKISKGNPSHIAALITPMLSQEAIVEVSADTRQLIITDVPSSIDTIAQLLMSLDAPETPFDVEAYTAQNVNPLELATLGKQILAPMSDNTPLELIPQTAAGTVYIVSTPFLIDRAMTVLGELDREPIFERGKAFSVENILNYPLGKKSASDVEDSLKKFAAEADKNGFHSQSLNAMISSMKYVKSTNSLMFIGSKQDLEIIHGFLHSIDGNYDSNNTSFYIFEPIGLGVTEMMKMIHEVSEHLKTTKYAHLSLIRSLDNAQSIPRINSILFTGSTEAITETKTLMASIESSYLNEVKQSGPSRFLIYNIKQANEEQIRASLEHLADYLEHNDYPNEDLINAIDTMKWVKSTNSLLFTGHAKALTELVDIIPTFDVPPENSKDALTQAPPSTEFIMYTPKNTTAAHLKQLIEETAKSLSESHLADPGFLHTLQSAKLLKASNQIIFTGDPVSLQRMQTLLENIDHSSPLEGKVQTFPVPIHFVDFPTISDALHKTSETLKSDNPVRKAIDTMTWVPPSHILLFHTTPEAMKKIKEVIDLTDTEENAKHGDSNFSLVRVEKGDGKKIVSQLEATANRLQASGSASPDLVNTLKSAEWIAGTNNILLTGPERSVARAKELIANYDIAPEATSNAQVFVYKPHYLTYAEIETSLKGIAEHAQSVDSGSSSPLTHAINSMRQVPDSNAVQFVGSEKTIEKLKTILATIDTAEHSKSNVHQAFGSNFLVYKVKSLPPTELIQHLKSIADESLSGKKKDSTLTRSINTVRYVQGSHSLIFTGNKQDLDKIHTLLERLDVSSGPTAPSTHRSVEGYQLFNPSYVPGSELIQMVKNFEEHLVVSGVQNQDMAEVVDHLSYIPRTNTVVVTGAERGVNQVVALLKRFDTEEAAGQGDADGIDKIGGTGFLVHKIQNISGSAIVGALQQISSDLARQQGGKKKNENLIDAIRSVQFIAPTNTLIATGDPQVLPNLRSLIEDIDLALKQVFVEVLVLETSTEHDLNFGLSWQTQGSVRNRLSWGSGNFAPSSDSPGINFSKNVTQMTGERIPGGADIPPLAGGYLGTIGDLVFHKGKTYATLGSLVNALKSDGDTTVVLSQKIVMQDNQNAKIFSGSNVPFTGSLVTTSGLSQTQNANLEYRNIGVTLNMTPIIGDNDMITLDIDEEISEEVNTGDDSSGSNTNLKGINGIRTTKTSMQTRVQVPDKHFLILSGTMRNQVIRSVSGVPCLGGLPLVGAAFTETKKQTQNRNVIIFVKPHIIKTSEVYENITRKQEEIYGQKSQCNPEDFDNAVELIRSPDDEHYDEDDVDFED